MKLFSAPPHHINALELVQRLQVHQRWPMAIELEFQHAIAAWLTRERIEHQREFRLGKAGTIDFYFPPRRIGLELKIKGSHAAVLRQLLDYARTEDIDDLILLTSHAPLGVGMPSELAGKPLYVITTWAGGL